MDLSVLILTITGTLVGLPALWIVYRVIKGPPHREPNFWCEVPSQASNAPVHVLFALRAPLTERAPTNPGELAAIAIASGRERAGMVISPGTYWIYAVPAAGPMEIVQALDTIWQALGKKDAVIPLDEHPVQVKEARR